MVWDDILQCLLLIKRKLTVLESQYAFLWTISVSSKLTSQTIPWLSCKIQIFKFYNCIYFTVPSIIRGNIIHANTHISFNISVYYFWICQNVFSSPSKMCEWWTQRSLKNYLKNSFFRRMNGNGENLFICLFHFLWKIKINCLKVTIFPQFNEMKYIIMTEINVFRRIYLLNMDLHDVKAAIVFM